MRGELQKMKRKKEKELEIRDIIEDLPITGYDEKEECFGLVDGSLLDLYQIAPKDLVNSDVDEIEMDCFRWAKFYKTYGNDCTVISMKFPCETGQQQAYWKKRLRENLNPEYAPMLKRKIEELEWREKNIYTQEFFLMFFYESEEEKQELEKVIASTLEIGGLGLVEKISRKKKEQIVFKLANKNSLIFQEKGYVDTYVEEK